MLVVIAFVLALVSCAGKDKVTPTEPTVHTHNFEEWEINKNPTCTEDGIKVRYCYCGEKQSEVVVSYGHSASNWIVDVEPTIVLEGQKHIECKSCGTVLETESIDRLLYPASEGLEFQLNDDGETYSVIGMGTCTDTDIVIPVTYQDKLVTEISSKAFGYQKLITSVTIPNSVTSIGSYAFAGSTSLKNITIPESITVIWAGTFKGCTSLNNVVIPESVTYIMEESFSRCSSLTDILIPNSVTAIGWEAFSMCTSLTSITIPNSVTSFESQMFRGCTNLKEVVLPNSITTIRSYLFNDCTSLENLVIPNSITRIDEGAFSGCKSLKNITIPSSVECIGTFAFSGCVSLTNVVMPSTVISLGQSIFSGCSSIKVYCETESQPAGWSTYWDLYQGYPEYIYISVIWKNSLEFALNTDGNSYSVIGIGSYNDTNLIIPETYNGLPVTCIGESAFYGCGNLTSLTIGKNIETIGNNAFYDCTGLTAIYFNAIAMDDLSVNNGVFHNTGINSSGITVTVGPDVTKLPSYLFNPCNNPDCSPKIIESIWEDGKDIQTGDYYLAYNAYIESVVVSHRIKSVGYGSVYGCTKLKKMIFEITEGWIIVDNSGYTFTLSAEYMSNSEAVAYDSIRISFYRYYVQ